MSDQNAINIIAKAKPLTASEVVAHKELITEVLVKTMKSGVHYDVIPGTDKPTLLKAGSETILTLFRIAVMPEIINLSTPDEIRYQIKATGVHQPTGTVVGEGVGECSSNEDKYMWRAIICEEEWENTPKERRRIKYGKKQGGHYEAKQVRTNPSDTANTILKMAKKRAQIDLTLTATAASDVFDQDLDELPPELRQMHEKKTREAQHPKSSAGNSQKPASEAQCRLLRSKLNNKGKTEEWLCAEMGVKKLEDLAMGQVNDAIAKAEE